jgi:hypothetical protein
VAKPDAELMAHKEPVHDVEIAITAFKIKKFS